MKKKYNVALLMTVCAVAFSFHAHAVKITFGTKCHPDGAGSCVGERGICLIVEIKKKPAARMIEPASSLGDDMAMGEMTITGAHSIRLEILAQQSDVELGPHFTLEEPIELNREVTQALGAQQVILRAGVYIVDYSHCRMGAVMLDADVH